MVKADVSRDYYQDLELKPGADVNEIKKQFKKLGTKYSLLLAKQYWL
jgi:curved DNA-binding protein CbpA